MPTSGCPRFTRTSTRASPTTRSTSTSTTPSSRRNATGIPQSEAGCPGALALARETEQEEPHPEDRGDAGGDGKQARSDERGDGDQDDRYLEERRRDLDRLVLIEQPRGTLV